MNSKPASILDGIVVVDFSQRSPGPYGTMLLADFGADVIVVDPPDALMTPKAKEPYNPLRRGKRSIQLDMKRPTDRAAAQKLIARADVVVDGFRPSTAAKLGLDHESVLKLNPNIVHCSLTGYGLDGPWAEVPGHDLNYVAAAGVLGMIGVNGRPVAPFNVVADFAGGGLYAALGIMLALFGRQRGRPVHRVDAALAEGALALVGHALAEASATGVVHTPGLHVLSGAAPFNDSYLCSDGGWLSISALEDRFFARLCAITGIDHSPADQWKTETWPALRVALDTKFATRSRDDWFQALVAADVCAAPVHNLAEVAANPHFRARGSVDDLELPDGRKVAQVATLPALDGQRAPLRRAPRPGEHTSDVLAWAGCTADEIAAILPAAAAGR